MRFVADFIGETNFLSGSVKNTANGVSKVKLDCGPEIAAASEVAAPYGKVTVVVRPEHSNLCAPKFGQLKGFLENAVYFGTDTHYHVKLEDGTGFMVRQQNEGGDRQKTFTKGSAVGIAIDEGTARILKD